MILLDALPMRTIAHDSYSSSRNYELTMKPRFLQLPYIKPSLVTSIQGFNATHAEDQKKPSCSKHSQPIGNKNRIIPPLLLVRNELEVKF